MLWSLVLSEYLINFTEIIDTSMKKTMLKTNTSQSNIIIDVPCLKTILDKNIAYIITHFRDVVNDKFVIIYF